MALDYDGLYRLIKQEIKNCDAPKPPLVSWLTDQQKHEAKLELSGFPIPPIESININYFEMS